MVNHPQNEYVYDLTASILIIIDKRKKCESGFPLVGRTGGISPIS